MDNDTNEEQKEEIINNLWEQMKSDSRIEPCIINKVCTLINHCNIQKIDAEYDEKTVTLMKSVIQLFMREALRHDECSFGRAVYPATASRAIAATRHYRIRLSDDDYCKDFVNRFVHEIAFFANYDPQSPEGAVKLLYQVGIIKLDDVLASIPQYFYSD